MLAVVGGKNLRHEVASVPTASSGLRWPKPIGSPVLDSLRPVIEHSKDVDTNVDKIVEVAGGGL